MSLLSIQAFAASECFTTADIDTIEDEGSTTTQWVDPEFYDDADNLAHWMVFQDESDNIEGTIDSGKVWVAEMDPAVGQCKNDCTEYLVSSSAAIIEQGAWKGPNFGLYDDNDTERWNLYYNRYDPEGAKECTSGGAAQYCLEIWEAVPIFNAFGKPGNWTPSAVTPDDTWDDNHRMNVLASMDGSRSDVHLVYGDRTKPNRMRWADENGNPYLDADPSIKTSFRWVLGESKFVATARPACLPGPACLHGAIAVVDTEGVGAPSTTIVTDDHKLHVDAYGWVAPEALNNEIMILSRAPASNEGELLVYKYDDTCGQDPCSPIYVLDKAIPLPTGANGVFDGDLDEPAGLDDPLPQAFLQSWEPFVYNNNSYFVGTVKPNAQTGRENWGESEIWVVSYATTTVGQDEIPDLACRVHLRDDDVVYHEGEVFEGASEEVPVPYIVYVKVTFGDPDHQVIYRSKVDLSLPL